MTRRNIPATAVSTVAQAAGARLDSAVTVTGVSDDSRTVEPGDLFFCIRGEKHDGHSLAAAAVAAGAVALVVDTVVDVDPSVAQIVVPDVRASTGPVVSELLGHPSASLRMVGVTGTNGKTSTVAFVAGILRACGHDPFVVGTLTGTRTTPEPLELQGLLADAVGRGATHCVMEVSSHALVLHRVAGITFDVAVFTNLGHDHLDFHGTMESYLAAKASLFAPGTAVTGVINSDDVAGSTILSSCVIPCVPVTRASLGGVRVTASSVSFTWRGHECAAPVGGGFAVDNLHAALEAAVALGIEPARAAHAVPGLEAPAGRFQSVPTGSDYAVIVDYAHTPDALGALLRSVRELPHNRVTVVFGCGGDRDASKRAEMGRVASGLADAVIITSDNPRTEDPLGIIEQVRAGTTGAPASVSVEPDRAVAIASAISAAGSGDIVVIAGKGHESHQEINGRLLEFSDAEAAREAVSRKGGSR